jgi:Cu(I)/Ag(I) efflux system periplasmic protein CusF
MALMEEEPMKFAALLALGGALTMGAMDSRAQTETIAGQVMKIDPSAGKITIKHGPIPKLGMDQGMTMVFKAQDPTALKALKSGDRIKFDAEQVNGQFVVTTIEKEPATRSRTK